MELRKQIKDGKYQVDAEAVAQALLAAWSANGTLGRDNPRPSVDTPEQRRSAAARFIVAPSECDASPSESERRIALG
jgi:hypothetical protein